MDYVTYHEYKNVLKIVVPKVEVSSYLSTARSKEKNLCFYNSHLQRGKKLRLNNEHFALSSLFQYSIIFLCCEQRASSCNLYSKMRARRRKKENR